jgi:hypothetical protein
MHIIYKTAQFKASYWQQPNLDVRGLDFADDLLPLVFVSEWRGLLLRHDFDGPVLQSLQFELRRPVCWPLGYDMWRISEQISAFGARRSELDSN